MKHLFSLLVLLLLCSFAHAQLGIKAGVNVSSLTQTDEGIENEQGRTGWNAGLSYRLNLSDAIAIQPELIYIERGSEFEINFGVFNTQIESEFKYVEIPLLAYLKLGDLPINFHAGPYFGYLADVEYSFRSRLQDGTIEDEVDDNRDNYSRSDYGFIAGVGLEFSRVTIDLRFSRGLQQREDGFQFRSLTYNEDAKNVAIQAFVGYFLWD